MDYARLLCAVLVSIVSFNAHSQQGDSTIKPLDVCHGAKRDFVIYSGVPLLPVAVDKQTGYFLLDWATTRSVIDIITFPVPPKPTFRGGKAYFATLNYFGTDVSNPQLSMQYLTAFELKDEAGNSVKESGILGTDQLDYAFTLDFRGATKHIYRQFQNSVCPDEILRSEGFSPLSTSGFYRFSFEEPNLATDDPDEPYPVLTVPLRIGGAWAPAQLDTGFGATSPHTINFNRAFLRDLRAHGVRLNPKLAKNAQGVFERVVSTLNTCVPDVSETITEYALDDDTPAELMGTDGKAVLSVHNLHLFLKESPPRAKSCGGVGTWDKAGAQLDASFATENDAVLIDSYSSRLWIKPHDAPATH